MAAIPSTSLFIPVEYPQTYFYAIELGSVRPCNIADFQVPIINAYIRIPPQQLSSYHAQQRLPPAVPSP